MYSKEFYMYGSQRLGYFEDEVFLGRKCIGKWCNVLTPVLPMFPSTLSNSVSVVFGKKRYELIDWLGNVRVVINDRKTPVNIGTTTVGYKAQVVNVNDYYSYGSTINERTYDYSSTKFRFAFNGKELDNEVYGFGNFQDYGSRMYNTRLGRFISPDPLIVGQKKYAWLSGYQFASNRPIDGIDMDGLEYATFWIYIQKNKVAKINITTDYQLKDKNTLGPGVQYNYITINEKNPYKIEKFEMKFERNRYGIYQGERNPKIPEIGGDPNNLKDTYILPPIDEADANAMQHDKDYDKVGASGLKGVLSGKTIEADEGYIKRANKIIVKFFKGEKDEISNNKITFKEFRNALLGKLFFETVKGIKSPSKNQFSKYGPKY